MIKIAPSILSADFAELGAEISRVEAGGADLLHVDVMDGHFVPNLTIGPPVIESIRKRTRLPLDVHLMIEEPERWIETYVRAGADWLTIHAEACPHLQRTLNQIREAGARAGVALNPSTGPGVLEYVLDHLDLVLVMSVNPGFGGQSFIPTAYEKIRKIRALLGKRPALISVDGGVKREHAHPLAQAGARVGLMDADIYGPSVPTILGISQTPQPGRRGILPVEVYGLKVISAGFFIKPDQAVVWRGPMLAKLIEQFLSDVEWGELDYLMVDLPPGTGDVQLTLCQRIPLTGAVIVSTPQDVALRVAEKALVMFQQLRCPILGLIENMSFFVCRHCGERENIFDTGGAERAAERWNVPLLGKIPLATSVREASDSGHPLVLADPESPAAAAFIGIAKNLAAQISIRNLAAEEQPALRITS